VLRRAIDGAARGADVAHLGRNMVVKSASPHLVPKRIWLHRAGGLAARSWRRMGIEARIDLVEGCLRHATSVMAWEGGTNKWTKPRSQRRKL
jgi:hypothetical protein